MDYFPGMFVPFWRRSSEPARPLQSSIAIRSVPEDQDPEDFLVSPWATRMMNRDIEVMPAWQLRKIMEERDRELADASAVESSTPSRTTSEHPIPPNAWTVGAPINGLASTQATLSSQTIDENRVANHLGSELAGSPRWTVPARGDSEYSIPRVVYQPQSADLMLSLQRVLEDFEVHKAWAADEISRLSDEMAVLARQLRTIGAGYNANSIANVAHTRNGERVGRFSISSSVLESEAESPDPERLNRAAARSSSDAEAGLSRWHIVNGIGDA